MCGPLCDAVLGVQRSANVLEELERSNLLLVPLDRRREWYRYHHLFRELLRVVLLRSDPALIPRLHDRAAGSFEANGHPDLAIEHAQAAGDADRRHACSPVSPRRRTPPVGWKPCHRWLESFEPRSTERYPQRYLAPSSKRWRVTLQEPSDGPMPPNRGRSTACCPTAAPSTPGCAWRRRSAVEAWLACGPTRSSRVTVSRPAAATALIVIPIGAAAATEMGVDVRPVMMSICVAAAASLLTPVATPVNLIAQGAAGYKFGDYWRLGAAVMVVFFVVSVVVVPIFWPFT